MQPPATVEDWMLSPIDIDYPSQSYVPVSDQLSLSIYKVEQTIPDIVPTCSDVILLLPTGYCMFSWKPEHFELLNHHLLNLYSLFIKGFKCTVRSKPFYGALPAEMKY